MANQYSMSFKDRLLQPKVQKPLVIITFAFIPVFLLLMFTYYPFVKIGRASCRERV